jgi:hypothetical protein
VASLGRNDPCPCGSGKKVKKCHPDRLQSQVPGRALAGPGRRPAEEVTDLFRRTPAFDDIGILGGEDGEGDCPCPECTGESGGESTWVGQGPRPGALPEPPDPVLPAEPPSPEAAVKRRVGAIEGKFVSRLLDFATGRFPDEFMPLEDGDWDPGADPALAQIMTPWSIYHYRVKGRTAIEWYLRERGTRLDAEEREVLEAFSRAWMSIWEVLEVDPGKSLVLRDVLTRTKRRVIEETTSRLAPRWAMLLARVVDVRGISVLGGLHPAPLGPEEGADTAAFVRFALGRSGGFVSPRDLRRNRAEQAMLVGWNSAVERKARAPMPRLCNTDGEDLSFTTDRFEFAAGDAERVATLLATVEGGQGWEEADEGRHMVVEKPGNAMHRNWDNTILAHLWLRVDRLEVETNSLRRADELRGRVERAGGDSVKWVARTEKSQDEALAEVRKAREKSPAPEEPTDEDPALLEMKKQFLAAHYAGWPDTPLPALGGKTPRDAVRDAAGRARVSRLLKEMEFRGGGGSPDVDFDFESLRKDLGIRA